MRIYRFTEEYKSIDYENYTSSGSTHLYFDSSKTARKHFTKAYNKELKWLASNTNEDDMLEGMLLEFNLFQWGLDEKAKELGSNYNDCWKLCKLVYCDGYQERTTYYSVCEMDILLEPVDKDTKDDDGLTFSLDL